MQKAVNLHCCDNVAGTLDLLCWWRVMFWSWGVKRYIEIAKSPVRGFQAALQAIGCHVSCKDFASPRDPAAPWEGFLGKIRGKPGELMHYKWPVVLSLVWCRQQGAAMSTMAPLLTATAYPSRPLGHLRLMISFLLSEFCSFPQASTLCSQISGVFYTMLEYFSNVSIPPNQNRPIILGRKPL